MAARRPRKSWGSHSRQYRDRIAQQAQQKYGLSRRSAREMYNRGTYRPGAKQAEDRVPQKVRKRNEQIIVDIVPVKQLRERVLAKFERMYQDTVKWGLGTRSRIKKRLDKMPSDLLKEMLVMDDVAFYNAAQYQSREQAPKRLRKFFDYTVPNPFFYH